MEVASLFDVYSRKARLAPALFAVLAPVLSLAILVPAVYQLIAGLISLMVASGILIVLANLSRYLGHKTQKRLVDEWGGLPSVTMLRHRDESLDPSTKERYCSFLARNIDSLELPSVKSEEQDPASADARYSSACKWLLEKTRDQSKFQMLFKENIEYGFRRNMRGLKPIGLVLSGGSAVLGTTALCVNMVFEASVSGWVAVILSAIAFLVWLLLVTDDWVYDAATSYGTRLLAACDVLA